MYYAKHERQFGRNYGNYAKQSESQDFTGLVGLTVEKSTKSERPSDDASSKVSKNEKSQNKNSKNENSKNKNSENKTSKTTKSAHPDIIRIDSARKSTNTNLKVGLKLSLKLGQRTISDLETDIVFDSGIDSEKSARKSPETVGLDFGVELKKDDTILDSSFAEQKLIKSLDLNKIDATPRTRTPLVKTSGEDEIEESDVINLIENDDGEKTVRLKSATQKPVDSEEAEDALTEMVEISKTKRPLRRRVSFNDQAEPTKLRNASEDSSGSMNSPGGKPMRRASSFKLPGEVMQKSSSDRIAELMALEKTDAQLARRHMSRKSSTSNLNGLTRTQSSTTGLIRRKSVSGRRKSKTFKMR